MALLAVVQTRERHPRGECTERDGGQVCGIKGSVREKRAGVFQKWDTVKPHGGGGDEVGAEARVLTDLKENVDQPPQRTTGERGVSCRAEHRRREQAKSVDVSEFGQPPANAAEGECPAREARPLLGKKVGAARQPVEQIHHKPQPQSRRC